MSYYFLFISLLLLSCTPKQKSELEFENLNEKASISELTFSSMQTQIFSPHCVQCHPKYNNYEVVFKERTNIVKVIHNNSMPKDRPPLTSYLKTLIADWVNSGAPFSKEEKPNLEPTSLSPTWKSLSEIIFIPRCVRCHNPDGEANFLNLSSRQEFLANKEFLLNNFKDGANSYLIKVITDPENPMPPLSSGLEQLNQEEIDTVIKWIEAEIPL